MLIQTHGHSLDLLRAITWQFEDAKNLQAIIQAKQQWYEEHHTTFWGNWQKDVFNLFTANDFGLAVWGIILDESRDAFIGAARPDYPAFGFTGRRNFGRGNFKRTKAGYLRISTEQYRLLLILRYYKLISRGTVAEINYLLQQLFAGQGHAYVLDGLNMTMTYVFTFTPESWQRFVFEDMDALPRPAGVGVKIRITTNPRFGFGKYRQNFTNAPFAPSLYP